jgi:hypothetical protein
MNAIQRVILAIMILATCAVLVLFGWYFIFNYRPAPPQFSGDVVQVMDDCIRSGTSSSANQVGGVTVSHKSVNTERIIVCLYDHDVTLLFHGDPVERAS